MSDEQTGVDTPTETAEPKDDMVPRSELKRAIDKRQAAKSEAAELRARLAEFEASQKEAEEAQIRAQGENEKIIAERDKALAAALGELEQMKWQGRFSNTVAAVSAKTGLDPVLTEALLLRERQVSGADVALGELTDDGVTDLAKALKLSAPQLFQTKGVGGSPGVPGLNGANKDAGEDSTNPAEAKVRALAKSLSTG